MIWQKIMLALSANHRDRAELDDIVGRLDTAIARGARWCADKSFELQLWLQTTVRSRLTKLKHLYAFAVLMAGWWTT